MKQLLQNMRNGKTAIEEVPVPSVRRGFALVKTAVSLVSAGTERMVVDLASKSLLGKAKARPDLVRQVVERARREGVMSTTRAALNRLDQPIALGYSSAGTITALGADIREFRVGQRVACGGAGYAVHAEYALVPRNLLAALPSAVDFESGAFATVAAVAMHGLRLARPQVGEQVAVIGLGLVGLIAVQLAAAAGCTVLGIEPISQRRLLAGKLGIRAVSPQRAAAAGAAFTQSRGFDSVLICADTPSSDPVALAAAIARDRARIVAVGAVGLDLPRKAYYDKELSLINARSYGPGRYDENYEARGSDYPIGYVRWTEGRNLESAVELMESGRLQVQPLISHRFPIERAKSAYDLISGKKKSSYMGILLTYPVTKESAARRVSVASPRTAPSGEIRLGVIGAGNFADAVMLPAIKSAGHIQLVGIAASGGLHAQHAEAAMPTS